MSQQRPTPPHSASPHSSSSPTQLQSPVARTALTLINASGSVVVDAGLPVSDLVGLAEAAGKRGVSMTLKRAGVRGTADLERIARAGRGRVTFELSA
jgi:hypothetical protein